VIAMKLKKNTVDAIVAYGIVIIAFAAAQLLISSGNMTRALQGQMIPICVYIVMAVSLNLVVGISGELSLGHAGFMCVGAFTSALWTNLMNGKIPPMASFILAILVGAACAALAGFLIPIILEMMHIDPALASSVFVTTVTDCLGFFFFLGLATLTMPLLM
jgi:branched-chain amino acid transport system permease protein